MLRKYLVITLTIISLSCTTYKIDNDRDGKKILFLGDSIFYGVGIPYNSKNSITVRVNNKTKGEYNILNISKIGSTLLSTGDYPFWTINTRKEVESYIPDIAIILLGTNDSKKHNWDKNRFIKEYIKLIHELENINPDIDLFICTPPPAFFNIWGIRGEIIEDSIYKQITSLENYTKVEVIDIHKSFNNDKNLLFDNIHPNIRGAEVIADKIYHTIFNKYIDQ